MREIPSWTLLSSATAPVVLGGGWTLAAAHQPPGYDPVRDTISALAAYGANDRWIMTAALAGLGTCHALTALGLRPAGTPSRAALGIGGVATILVAAFPQPKEGSSTAHTIAASVAFGALAIWPILSPKRSPFAPLLRLRSASVASATLLALVAWFVFELHGNERGLAERAAAGAESLWPLAVVLSALYAERRAEP